MKRFSTIWLTTLVMLGTAMASSAGTPRLKVSDNHRFLVHEDGRPFFYLGDIPGEDWVLVLDDAAKNFPPPGKRAD